MSSNSYELLGLNSDTPNWNMDKLPMSRRKIEGVDRIIQKAYNDRINKLIIKYKKAIEKLKLEKDILTYGIEFNTNSPKKEEIKYKLSEIEANYEVEVRKIEDEFQRKIAEIRNAFIENVGTEELRMLYEQCSDFKTERPYLDGDSAYDFLKISEQYIYSLGAKEADLLIKKVYTKKLIGYEKLLSKPSTDQEIKKEIQQKISLLNEYYKKISSEDSRIKYRSELDLEEKRREDELIKEKCSKVDQFNPDLIGDISGSKALKYKKSIDSVTLYLPDIRKRNVFLTKTGEILYKNSSKNISSYISEYEVSRIVNGEERVDKIYANLNLPELSIDKETGNPSNPEYYDCVVNELLSEVVIKGAKYNKGYVGGVEKIENGQYRIVLGDTKLNDIHREELAAVMIYNGQRLKNERESDEGR